MLVVNSLAHSGQRPLLPCTLPRNMVLVTEKHDPGYRETWSRLPRNVALVAKKRGPGCQETWSWLPRNVACPEGRELSPLCDGRHWKLHSARTQGPCLVRLRVNSEVTPVTTGRLRVTCSHGDVYRHGGRLSGPQGPRWGRSRRPGRPRAGPVGSWPLFPAEG